jgi:thioredoxin 1
MDTPYLAPEQAPTRAEVDALPGAVLVEFGTEWCGHCRALAPVITRLLVQHPEIRHLKVEDGPGRPLGRSFHVRLWPNLVFVKDGKVVRQLARPSHQELREAFALVASPAGAPSAP